MSKKFSQALVSLALSVVLVGAFAQPALASSYLLYYYNDAPEYESHSWSGSSISGGSTSLNIQLAEFKMYQETTSGYGGGYTIYGWHIATAPGWSAWGHGKVSGTATSKCNWYIPGITPGGELLLGCKVRRY